jgi:hypothetical protein
MSKRDDEIAQGFARVKRLISEVFASEEPEQTEISDVLREEFLLIDGIVHQLDLLQDASDMHRVNINLKDSKTSWNDPIIQFPIRALLWKEFGLGSAAYAYLVNSCKARGYQPGHTLGVIHTILNAMKDVGKSK